MGILDNLERGLERAVQSVFSAGSKRVVKPVEIANSLRNHMDREAFAISTGRTLAPNEFTISFAPENFEQVQHWGTSLAEELCTEAIRHAREQGYTLHGAVKVSFIEDDAVSKGSIDIDSQTTSSNIPASQQRASETASPASPSGAYSPQAPSSQATTPLVPVVEVNGTRYSVNGSSAVIGRATDADITINDPGASRRHLEIQVTGDAVRAKDLGSTNGFYLNGRKVQGSTGLQHGDVLTIGQTRVLFRLIADPRTSQGRR